MRSSNPDLLSIFVSPILIALAFVFLNYQLSVKLNLIILAILIYQLMTYDKRFIYGITGLRILSVPSLVFITYTIFIALPSVYVLMVYDKAARTPYFISVLSFYLLFPLGLRLAGIFYRVDLKKTKKLKSQNFQKSLFDGVLYEILFFLLFFSILVTILFLFRTKVYPIVELVKNPGDYLNIKLLREESFKLLNITFIERYLFHWNRSLFYPLGVIGSLFLYLVYKLKKYKYLFIAFFSLGFATNILTIEKSPTAVLILAIMALIFLKQKKIRGSFFVLTASLSLFIPVMIMVMLHYGKDNLFKVIYVSLFNRLFLIPSLTVYEYFVIFPGTHQFLMGRGTQLFSWLHPEGQFQVANYVAKVWWKDPFTSGSANVNFIGNFWADFGYIGVFLSIFIIGFIIHALQYGILQISGYKKNIIYAVSASLFVPIFSFNFFSSNITTLFFTRGLFLYIIFLYYIYRRFKGQNE